MAEPIRFFFDQHIPLAVAQGLRQRRVDVLTAQDAGRCSVEDLDQLKFAASEGRVLMTFDSDYIALAARGVSHAGITWCQATKYSIGKLIHALLLVHGILDRNDMRNHVEYL